MLINLQLCCTNRLLRSGRILAVRHRCPASDCLEKARCGSESTVIAWLREFEDIGSDAVLWPGPTDSKELAKRPVGRPAEGPAIRTVRSVEGTVVRPPSDARPLSHNIITRQALFRLRDGTGRN